MNNVMHKFYRHKTGGKIYNVIGIGRLTSDPSNYVVIYRQLYDSTLKNNKSVILPVGSIWVRNLFEFNDKMEPYELNEKE